MVEASGNVAGSGFGFGINFQEIEMIIGLYILATAIGNYALFWNSENAIDIFNNRIMGFPVCKSTYLGIGFCAMPSIPEITATVQPFNTFLSAILSGGWFDQVQVSIFGGFITVPKIFSLLILPIAFLNALWIGLRLLVTLKGIYAGYSLLNDVHYKRWIGSGIN